MSERLKFFNLEGSLWWLEGRQEPFYQTKLEISCDSSDFSFLPLIPAGVKCIELSLDDAESLIQELKSLKLGELKFKKLVARNRIPSDNSTAESIWQQLVTECNRLQIEVEGNMNWFFKNLVRSNFCSWTNDTDSPLE